MKTTSCEADLPLLGIATCHAQAVLSPQEYVMRNFLSHWLGRQPQPQKTIRQSSRLTCESLEDRMALSPVSGANLASFSPEFVKQANETFQPQLTTIRLQQEMQKGQELLTQLTTAMELRNDYVKQIIQMNSNRGGFPGSDSILPTFQELGQTKGIENQVLQEVIMNLPKVQGGSGHGGWIDSNENPNSNPFWDNPDMVHIMPVFDMQILDNAGYNNVNTIGQLYGLGAPQEFGISPGLKGTLVGNYSDFLGGITRHPPGSATPPSNLLAQATGRTPAVADNFAKATGRTAAVADNFAKATGRTAAVADNFAKATGRTAAVAQNFAQATGRTSAVAHNYAQATGRTAAVAQNFAQATGRTSAVTQNFAQATGRTPAVAENYAQATGRTAAVVDNYAQATQKTAATADNFAQATGRTPAATKVFAQATGRTLSDAQLFAQATGRI
jgi:hypothetical protein